MLVQPCVSSFLKENIKLEKGLLREIQSFKLWAETVPKGFGEWETEYLHWDKIYLAADQLIETVPAGEWEGELMKNFLYILARDNECENINDTLILYPDQLIAIARHAVNHKDSDARWQIAHALGKINADDTEIQPLLKTFLADEDEYVRRRASFSWEEQRY